ncbi:hypothetical protein MK489_23205 [Myxococcota bacterium]|nr:hypothetical protein [Myxococcota bacterium]
MSFAIFRRLTCAIFFPVTFVIAFTSATPPVAAIEATEDVSPTNRFDAERFTNPSSSDGPWTRWWWPGNDVEPGEIRREITLFAKMGFAGVEIQPVMFGLPSDLPAEQTARIRSVDTSNYYSNLAVALDAAATRGISVDITNGSSWPTGSKNVQADDSLLTLTAQSNRFRRDTLGAIDIPEVAGERIALVIAPIVRESGRGTRRRVWLDPASAQSVTVSEGSTRVELEPSPGPWEIIAVGSKPSERQVLLHAGDQPAFIVDHFSVDDVTAHLDYLFGPRTGLPKFFGRSLHGVFNDSFELAVSRHYAEGLISEFRERRGYDVTPYLPTVLREGYNNGYRQTPAAHRRFSMGEINQRVMYDYDLTLSDLFIERFLERTQTWASARGLAYRAQPYGLILDVIRAAGAVSIPEAEQLYAGGHRLFVKLVTSGAELHGADVVSAEALGFARSDYAITPPRIKQELDGLFSAGINQIVYHGSPYRYTVRTGDVSPWNPWSTPLVPRGSFSTLIAESDHFWKYQHLINAYVARIQYAMQLGRPDTNVLIYYPYLGTRALSPQRTSPDKSDSAPKKQSTPEQRHWRATVMKLTEALESRGLRWAFANDESLQTARVANGEIDVRGRRYTAVIVAAAEWIQAETATRLQEIADANGSVILHGSPPDRQPGMRDYGVGDRKVEAAMAAIVRASANAPTESLDEIVSLVAKQTDGIRFSEPYPTLKHTAVKLDNGDSIVFLHNIGAAVVTSQLQIPARLATDCHWLNPVDGSISRARVTSQSFVHRSLETSESTLLHCALDPSHLNATLSTNHVDFIPDAARGHDPELILEIETFDFSLMKNGKPALPLKNFRLSDWKSRDGLRFASETGVYTAEIQLDLKRSDSRYLLDLGVVHSTAEVIVNEGPSETLLFKPHRVDVTNAIRQGRNRLKIEVTPPTLNGLIGRAREGESALAHLAEGREPMAAGLIGPVRLLQVERAHATQ